jgi:hypothetical protein
MSFRQEIPLIPENFVDFGFNRVKFAGKLFFCLIKTALANTLTAVDIEFYLGLCAAWPRAYHSSVL